MGPPCTRTTGVREGPVEAPRLTSRPELTSATRGVRLTPPGGVECDARDARVRLLTDPHCSVEPGRHSKTEKRLFRQRVVDCALSILRDPPTATSSWTSRPPSRRPVSVFMWPRCGHSAPEYSLRTGRILARPRRRRDATRTLPHCRAAVPPLAPDSGLARREARARSQAGSPRSSAKPRKGSCTAGKHGQRGGDQRMGAWAAVVRQGVALRGADGP